jgi:hypothetical protein
LETLTSNRLHKLIVQIYFALTALLVICELFNYKQILLIFKPMLIPLLIVLYFLTSSKKNVMYILALAFALLSNIFFLSDAPIYLVYGIIAFMAYRILSIIVVVRLVDKILWLPFIIATLPFLFIFSCLINLTLTSDMPSFYPTIINGLLIAALAGIALSNYVMNDNKANSWLAISTLLFIVLVFLFMIQNYYLANIAFKPMSAFIFAFAHYTFYKFVIEAEGSGKS